MLAGKIQPRMAQIFSDFSLFNQAFVPLRVLRGEYLNTLSE
jgi:hypothetical protein